MSLVLRIHQCRVSWQNRLKGGPQVGHMRYPQLGTRSRTHQGLKSALRRPIMVSHGVHQASTCNSVL